ncbi:MAG: SIS domain-containing protein, partial [Pseudomonadota bacterium]|nr:SIS domain-containing protein [Pseudomonadota bacterium]
MTHPTQMRREIEEIPQAVERLLSEGAGAVTGAAKAVRDGDIRYLISVARGSSDHACTYLKYASELMLGLPIASVGPSVASIYGAPLKAQDALCIAVSQSGASPDIVQLTQQLTDAGAYSVAITNNAQSALAGAASTTLPIHAGPELSVAATKTYVTSLVTGLWLLAEIKQDAALLAAIKALPAQLEAARAETVAQRGELQAQLDVATTHGAELQAQLEAAAQLATEEQAARVAAEEGAARARAEAQAAEEAADEAPSTVEAATTGEEDEVCVHRVRAKLFRLEVRLEPRRRVLPAAAPGGEAPAP